MGDHPWRRGLYEPTYEGAKAREWSALPYFSITYGDTFTLDVDGVSARVCDGDALGMTARIG
jgi:outer membrane scaffolding protein for murein synthesis (MipA/OmpV family)